MAAPASTPAILVAIDFGTTFSGIAWSHTARPEVQTSIIQWPDPVSGTLEGITSEKVPTELVYDGETYRWGFQIEERENRHQLFKLSLNPTMPQMASDLGRMFPDLKALPPSYDMSIEKLVTDYLTALRKHTLDILTYKLGRGLVESTPISFIVTVPAIWSDSAKNKTRQCAKSAGMGDNVKMICEPEAAAIHSLDMMDPHGLNIGEAFVVVDAGGGTVDLITYEIVELKPMLKVREVTLGTGDMCGSSLLNRIFRKYLEDQFKRLSGWDEDTLEGAMERFEKTTKRTYTGDDTREFVIPVAGLRDNPKKGVKRARHRMPGAEVGRIFRPVVEEVIKLIKNQIANCDILPKALLLVGGFGQSPCLREAIRREIPNIQLMQPANGWTAVVRGALTIAMGDASPGDCRIRVTSRRARRYYGIEIEVPFEQAIHERNRSYWDNFKGRVSVLVMSWVVHRGHEIKNNESRDFVFSRRKLVADGPFHDFSVAIDAFDSLDPPVHKTPNVRRVVKVTADLSSIPAGKLPIKKGADGQDYYYLNFSIKVTFYSGHTDYALWYNNECYGSVAAEYV